MELYEATSLTPLLRERGWIGPDEPVQVRELTGGVSNVVLYVARPEAAGPDFVVKQSRPQLRVAETWLCSMERIWREIDALQFCAQTMIAPTMPLDEGAESDPQARPIRVPQVLFESRADYLYGMTAAPAGSPTWKELLLGGVASPAVAQAAGYWLGQLHAATWKSPAAARRFGKRQLFDELRLDPYYRQLGRRFPDWRPRLDDLVDQVWAHPLALVHADYSPKNLLVWPGGLMLVDFETAHYGDPAFDLGFLLAHLALKTAWARQRQLDYRPLVDAFWNAYVAQVRAAVSDAELQALSARATLNFAGCTWARLDGKSTVEYLPHEPMRTAIRALCQGLLAEPAADWREAWVRTERAIVARTDFPPSKPVEAQSMSNQFEDPSVAEHDEILALIANNDAETLHRAIIGIALYDTDFDFIVKTCLRLARHPDEFVRGNAILSFGHCARRFGTLDETLVRPLVEAGMTDSSKHVRGQAWAAAEDIQHFLGWTVAGYSDED